MGEGPATHKIVHVKLSSSGKYGETQWRGEGPATSKNCSCKKLSSSGKYGETQWMGEGPATS